MTKCHRNAAARLKAYLCLSCCTFLSYLIGPPVYPASQAADSVRTGEQNAAPGEQYGPENLLKTVKTPFTCGETQDPSKPAADDIGPIEMSLEDPRARRSLGDRLFQTRLYLPDKMSLGKVAEFTVKGRPGKWVALAMADKDAGAKPIFGHKLRLGPDRKLVAVAKIPESGVAKLLVETPIQGDLVGSNLYFEAAVWSKADMRDMELAQCVTMQEGQSATNAVLISPQFIYKKGLKIVPTTTTNGLQKTSGLSANQP